MHYLTLFRKRLLALAQHLYTALQCTTPSSCSPRQLSPWTEAKQLYTRDFHGMVGRVSRRWGHALSSIAECLRWPDCDVIKQSVQSRREPQSCHGRTCFREDIYSIHNYTVLVLLKNGILKCLLHNESHNSLRWGQWQEWEWCLKGE